MRSLLRMEILSRNPTSSNYNLHSETANLVRSSKLNLLRTSKSARHASKASTVSSNRFQATQVAILARLTEVSSVSVVTKSKFNLVTGDKTTRCNYSTNNARLTRILASEVTAWVIRYANPVTLDLFVKAAMNHMITSAEASTARHAQDTRKISSSASY